MLNLYFYMVNLDLEEGCEFVHESEHVAEVDEGDVDDGSQQHEHDWVHVLDLRWNKYWAFPILP